MKNPEELEFFSPGPIRFIMETRRSLAGLSLSAAQQKALALLEIDFMKKLSMLEIEFFDNVVTALDHMESKG
jgi:hypothetical protein